MTVEAGAAGPRVGPAVCRPNLKTGGICLIVGTTAHSPPNAAKNGLTSMACATQSLSARQVRRVSSCCRVAGWSSWSFGWLTHWGGLLRERAGRLDVAATRLACAAALAGLQALCNPLPVQNAAWDSVKQALSCRATLVHGVVSPGAPTPGFGCRVSTGDYVTPFPTTSRTAPAALPLPDTLPGASD